MNRTNVHAGRQSNERGRNMQQITLNCGILKDFKKSKGKTTYCIFATMITANAEINLTYDCTNDNIVIHEWYKLPAEANIENITSELLKYFRSIK